MCAVIGVLMRNPSNLDFEMLHKIFLESSIRGLHATGLSYVKDNIINTISFPVPASKFDFNFSDYVNEDGNLYLVGHCRYSTSDLEYNQPIGNDGVAIVHNGVITQELPENWDKIYPYTFETKNDSELVLHSDDPLREFPEASMAVCELYADGRLRFYRNGKRPLYLTNMANGCIITSTADIANRAEVGGNPVEILMNHYITFDEHLAMTIEKVDMIDAVDLQHYAVC